MEFWIATGNKGKLEEFKLLLQKNFPEAKVHSAAELPHYSSPPENGQTFLDNARIKARSLKAMKPNVWIIADDSGLEVEGLGNLPGVHSARYAGPKAADSENVAKLLKMILIRAGTNRKARFQCCLVVFNPAGEESVHYGTLEGEIAKTPRGVHGFGYDPVFVPTGQTQTLAEIGAGFKNQHSHRAKALQDFISKVKV
jgi:XTP/dITP diphosphohydrolase